MFVIALMHFGLSLVKFRLDKIFFTNNNKKNRRFENSLFFYAYIRLKFSLCQSARCIVSNRNFTKDSPK